jgi:hypothetical protein
MVSEAVTAILYTVYVYQLLDRCDRLYGGQLCRYVDKAFRHLGIANRTGRLCEEITRRMPLLGTVKDRESEAILRTFIRVDCQSCQITAPSSRVGQIGVVIDNNPDNTVMYFDSRFADKCGQYAELATQFKSESKVMTESLQVPETGKRCMIHYGTYIPTLPQLYQVCLLYMLSIPEIMIFPKLTVAEMSEAYAKLTTPGGDSSLKPSTPMMSYDDYFDYITISLDILPQTADNNVIGILYCLYVLIKVKS